MKQEVDSYKKKGKVEAAHRFREQVNLLEEQFVGCHEKLNTFTSPQANFESRLNRALGELRTVERSSCILDVASAGPSNVQDQYKHCLKMYRTLSECKGEIENVIKTGRKVCEEKATKNPKKLTLSIDALKHLYNSLGEHVTQSKINLEKLIRLTNALQLNISTIEKWLDHLLDAAELDEQRISDIDDTLLLTNEQICAMIVKCNETYGEYSEICEPVYLEELRNKLDSLSERVSYIMNDDQGKHLLEIKSTLQNLDNISLDTLRLVPFKIAIYVRKLIYLN